MFAILRCAFCICVNICLSLCLFFLSVCLCPSFFFVPFLIRIEMLDVCNPQVCVLAAGENQSKKNGRHCNLLEDRGAGAYRAGGNCNTLSKSTKTLKISVKKFTKVPQEPKDTATCWRMGEPVHTKQEKIPTGNFDAFFSHGILND